MAPAQRHAARILLVLGCLVSAGPTVLAHDTKAVPAPRAEQRADRKVNVRTTSLPARGLFKGDQLSDTAKARLSELIIDALSLDVEVALIVPAGPWKIDDSGHNERDLTPARLQAVRKFLTERGVEGRRIYVESRIDDKIKEPRLDVQLLGPPASN